MICKLINQRLDDYVDGALGADEQRALDEHIDACAACRQLVEAERHLRELLANYPAPRPDAGYFDRALARATHLGSTRQRNRWVLTGFGAAIAAGLLAWIIGGMLFKAPDLATPPDTLIAGVTMALEEPRTINLVFSSATELDDATLTVNLPAGIEIEGFAGQREITWMTDLRPGKNILPLRLVATAPTGGELLARLEHHERNRTFRIRVTVS